MEALPVEMVELIAQQLTPRDLASCSAVCRTWYEVFNQDWVWKPHCDPELEEPLRTTPRVVTPAFVIPEAEKSTLSPNCHWKLAFMRENHLWQNWKNKETVKYKEENVIKFGNRGSTAEVFFYAECDNHPSHVAFLTDTLVVALYVYHIHILDVSVTPPLFVAEYYKPDLETFRECTVISPAMIVVEKQYSVDIFNVDVMNKTVKLKHNISLDQTKDTLFPHTCVAKDYYLSVNTVNLKLTIFDLNTGEVVKEELCPVKKIWKTIGRFRGIFGSTTSDFVVIAIADYDKQFIIYNLKELAFLPELKLDFSDMLIFNIVLHDCWAAFADHFGTMIVYNIETQEVLLHQKFSHYLLKKKTCNNCFIFGGVGNKSWIKCYSPLDKTLTTLYENSDFKTCELLNDSFVAVYGEESQYPEIVLKLSNRVMVKCDVSIKKGCKINPSFSRVLNIEYFNYIRKPSWYVSYCW